MSSAHDRGARAAGDWTRIRERGSYWGLRFTVACVRVFGRTLAAPLVGLVVAYFFVTDRTGRTASREFLARVEARRRGEVPKPGERVSLRRSFRHYRAFATSIVDRVVMWSDPATNVTFDTRGREHFDALHARGQGAVVVGAHLGSFDALRVVSAKDGVRVNVLMYTDNAPLINDVFRDLSPDTEVRVIAPSANAAETALRLRACIDRGEHVAILADRVEPADRGRTQTAEFLGAPAVFPQAPFLLAAVLRCPALLVLGLRGDDGRYDVRIEPLHDPKPVEAGGAEEPPSRGSRRELADRLLADYVLRLEHYVVQSPDQWFNFYDFWAGARPEVEEVELR